MAQLFSLGHITRPEYDARFRFYRVDGVRDFRASNPAFSGLDRSGVCYSRQFVGVAFHFATVSWWLLLRLIGSMLS